MKLYGLLQALVIALCVGASFAYLVRSFAPSLWSRGMDAMCAVLPKSMRPERRSRGQTAAPRGGCASCNDCGGCGPRK